MVINVNNVSSVTIVNNTRKHVIPNRFVNNANINAKYVIMEWMNMIIMIINHVNVLDVIIVCTQLIIQVHLQVGKHIDVLIANHILIVKYVKNN